MCLYVCFLSWLSTFKLKVRTKGCIDKPHTSNYHPHWWDIELLKKFKKFIMAVVHHLDLMFGFCWIFWNLKMQFAHLWLQTPLCQNIVLNLLPGHKTDTEMSLIRLCWVIIPMNIHSFPSNSQNTWPSMARKMLNYIYVRCALPCPLRQSGESEQMFWLLQDADKLLCLW